MDEDRRSAAELPPRTYPHGVPCWVDTEQPDVDAALAFYGALFGWDFEDRLPPGAGGRYVVASLGGQDVAAIASGQGPPEWITYVAVDDVDSAARGVPDLGGVVLDGPTTVGPPGRMAVVRDPQGAAFRLWQPGTRLGAQRVDMPGAWVFSTLRTPDVEQAMRFYGPLLGWEVSPDLGLGMARVRGYGDHLQRTVNPEIDELQVDAPPGFRDVVAGVETGPGAARHTVMFAVADRDDAARAAERAGGTVLSSSDTQWTRDAVVRDPQGAELTLSQYTPPA
ncbi:VOC family protein [Cellulosimicrobium arenosum]|uniref:VOC family protein n=1 Tax=Cellulosimicrobium arenosum TaxID=2708133 RepID=A0A927G961_9MICO|nr:VOC family protein [Cellulosimicrobium arenosum]MBD8078630.1 VOC family protein [Cellulosimicrobium arenosum]